MNTYLSYKDSGIEWIGEIPSEWDVVRNKYLFDVTKNIVGEESDKYQLLSLTKRGVVLRDIESGKGKFPESFDTYQTVDKGDLIFCLYDIDETPRTIGISNYSGMITSSYKVVKCNTLTDPKFIYYNYLSIDDVKGLRPYYTGLRKVVRTETFLNLNVRVPSLQEQQQISNYLDYKTSRIDTLIEKTKQKIELLKEQCTSLINTTVTKGLNPNVEMTDSGIEWIGEIPSEWNIKKLKYIGNLYGGLTGKSGEDFNDEDNSHNKPYIPFTNIFNNTYISDKHYQYVNVEPDERQNRVRKNDLFFLMSSEGYEDLGKSSILISEIDELYLNSFCKGFRINTGKANPLFINYQLSGNTQRKLISIEGRGFTRINLRQDKLNSTYMFIPPLQEQQQIVDYLDKETSKIDKLVDIESKRIVLLKEYRQSLISDVVTGKVDVRDEALV